MFRSTSEEIQKLATYAAKAFSFWGLASRSPEHGLCRHLNSAGAQSPDPSIFPNACYFPPNLGRVDKILPYDNVQV